MRMRFVLSAVAVVALAMPVAWATTSGSAGAPAAEPAARTSASAADAMIRPAGISSAVVAAPAAAPATAQAAVYFEFVKNHHHPTDSTLYLYERRPGRPIPTLLGRWRAGSGLGTTVRGGRNACAVGRGWLPNGWYAGVAHLKHFNGGKVFGLVWQLQDKRCKNGTLRTELFIHSEMTPGGGQACKPGHYREDQCWDGPHDYLSEGCIKLRPADLRAADRLFRSQSNTGFGTKRYPHLLFVRG